MFLHAGGAVNMAAVRRVLKWQFPWVVPDPDDVSTPTSDERGTTNPILAKPCFPPKSPGSGVEDDELLH